MFGTVQHYWHYVWHCLELFTLCWHYPELLTLCWALSRIIDIMLGTVQHHWHYVGHCPELLTLCWALSSIIDMFGTVQHYWHYWHIANCHDIRQVCEGARIARLVSSIRHRQSGVQIPEATRNFFYTRLQTCERRLLASSCLSVLTVCLSVRTEQLASHWTDFQ